MPIIKTEKNPSPGNSRIPRSPAGGARCGSPTKPRQSVRRPMPQPSSPRKGFAVSGYYVLVVIFFVAIKSLDIHRATIFLYVYFIL